MPGSVFYSAERPNHWGQGDASETKRALRCHPDPAEACGAQPAPQPKGNPCEATPLPRPVSQRGRSAAPQTPPRGLPGGRALHLHSNCTEDLQVSKEQDSLCSRIRAGVCQGWPSQPEAEERQFAGQHHPVPGRCKGRRQLGGCSGKGAGPSGATGSAFAGYHADVIRSMMTAKNKNGLEQKHIWSAPLQVIEKKISPHPQKRTKSQYKSVRAAP